MLFAFAGSIATPVIELAVSPLPLGLHSPPLVTLLKSGLPLRALVGPAAAGAGRTGGREIARIGLPGDVSVVIDVERHTESAVEAVTADIGRIDQRGACRIELGYEGVSAARQGPLQRASGYREIGRRGVSRDIGCAIGVNRNRIPAVAACAAEPGGVDDC